ncbi:MULTISPECIES: SGNH/GDSL hydrolase family protein [Sphingobacterium]|uniref:SGNH/GDSL hydrolase family protein n=1 Tax=Sphingobacterium kitahiroshimense TaxID=470446 RepID=A0ABV0BRX9_9SPHI|nr:SGNH/GDSL hydrolase family protein [Sphingobacterium sp. IITKGP-BTPF85]KKX47199.1 hypothetical protein L950_0227810 [Sphingobacterium sp. IITKGP-BTPF85]
MKLNLVLSFASLFVAFSSFAQQSINWNDPLKNKVIQGRIHTEELPNYYRLPESLKSQVRSPVWSLGTNSAGLYVDFQTDAEAIKVRYKVSGSLNMPHMPTIGVSGVDLYAQDDRGNWNWAFGNYNFADTVTYNYKALGKNSNFTYRLYLPLYNTVEWLEIGVGSDKSFKFVVQEGKPVVVYGTSIAQGACATRPGLAWSNMLGRAIKNPVINVAFSGNGRLEQPIIDHINQVDAAVFILDCIPNLALTKDRTAQQLDSLLSNAVTEIRKKHPKTPIIVTEHSSGFNNAIFNLDINEEYKKSSAVANQFVNRIKQSGDKNLYLLTNREIGLDINSTVDSAHPNDIGMKKIADAYQKLINKVVKK